MAIKTKQFFRQLHMLLGLASGLVVFIVGITGCCWVFQEEITHWIDGDRSVPTQELPFISLTKAKEIAQAIHPDKTIHGTLIKHAKDPIEVIFYEAEPEFYQSVYLNPYTGEVLDQKDHRAGFFWFVLRGHLYLWLPQSIGTHVMSYGTMIFVIMLITGIVLWWPKNKKARKQRFKFNWKPKTKWKRKNFDLHSVVGFYVSALALVISFSGLIMAFGWIYYMTYLSWGGDKAPQFIIPNNETAVEEGAQLTSRIDELYPLLVKQFPNHESMEFHYPHADSASIYVEVSHQAGVYYNSDYRFYDQYTLKEVATPGIYGTYAHASLADKVIRMNYDIHVGAIGGITGKIIAFIVSLIAASLPVTGFLLWWGRNMKKKPNNNPDIGLSDLNQINKQQATPSIRKKGIVRPMPLIEDE